ncbi:MAG TPA: DUF5684 domain-containing protein [Candidatus Microsaccharimonas sp.]|nr:DUF5684 domain-containing protein [Candidatus Microsaccharimonas sp.]
MIQTLADTFTYTTTTTTTTSPNMGALLAIYGVVLLIAIPLIIIPLWKIYKKAGKPGWAAIIPVYSTWVLFEITGFPAWWSLLTLVPFVNLFPAVVSIMAVVRLAKLFGKSTGFGVLAIFFPWICYPILGYGSAQFNGGTSTTPFAPMPPQPPMPQSPSVDAPVNPVQPPVDQNQPPQEQ